MGNKNFSRPRLQRMHDILARHVDRGTLPGLVTLISRRGETHVDAIGNFAVDGGAPMQRETIFRIASMTKSVTAVAALILVEECVLRLDDAVDEWLPELANRQVLKQLNGPLYETVPANRAITLRDLLTLRMGFGYTTDLASDSPIWQAMGERHLAIGPEPTTAPSIDVWMASLGSLPLMAQPGERWMYETGSDVLGVLVARAAGQPLGDFMQERIFTPLGMKDTAFYVLPEKLERLPPCYQVHHETGALALFDEAGGYWSQPPAFPAGGGGLVSTVDDFLAFGEMLRNGGKLGEVRILSRPAVEVMTTNQLTDEQQRDASSFFVEPRGWGFGLSVVTGRTDLSMVPGRFGWEGGYGTSWASDPKEELTAILMTQLLFPQAAAIYQDFWTGVYQAIED